MLIIIYANARPILQLWWLFSVTGFSFKPIMVLVFINRLANRPAKAETSLFLKQYKMPWSKDLLNTLIGPIYDTDKLLDRSTSGRTFLRMEIFEL